MPTTALGGSVGDYIALLKPRVMSLVVFTALVGMAIAPGRINPVIGVAALLAIAVGAGACRRAQHVVRRRHRRAHAPHGDAAGPGRPARAGRGAGFGLTLAVGSVTFLGLATNSLAAGAARLHHLLLRRRLHDVAEALDAAEHRHRRRRRRAAAGDRLGGGHRLVSASRASSSSPSS